MATQAEIAIYLDIGERHVRRLIEDGVLPGSRGKGGLDEEACRLAYIRYLRGLGSEQIKPATEADLDPLAEQRPHHPKAKRGFWRRKKKAPPVVREAGSLSF